MALLCSNDSIETLLILPLFLLLGCYTSGLIEKVVAILEIKIKYLCCQLEKSFFSLISHTSDNNTVKYIWLALYKCIFITNMLWYLLVI